MPVYIPFQGKWHVFCFPQELVAIAIVGIFSFSGGVAAAVSGKEWKEQIDTWESQGGEIFGRGHRIPRNLRAIAVSKVY